MINEIDYAEKQVAFLASAVQRAPEGSQTRKTLALCLQILKSKLENLKRERDAIEEMERIRVTEELAK